MRTVSANNTNTQSEDAEMSITGEGKDISPEYSIFAGPSDEKASLNKEIDPF